MFATLPSWWMLGLQLRVPGHVADVLTDKRTPSPRGPGSSTPPANQPERIPYNANRRYATRSLRSSWLPGLARSGSYEVSAVHATGIDELGCGLAWA